jgi:hypothetical protein
LAATCFEDIELAPKSIISTKIFRAIIETPNSANISEPTYLAVNTREIAEKIPTSTRPTRRSMPFEFLDPSLAIDQLYSELTSILAGIVGLRTHEIPITTCYSVFPNELN